MITVAKVGSEFSISETHREVEVESIARLSTGGFITVRTESVLSDNQYQNTLLAQRYDASGDEVGDAIVLIESPYTTGGSVTSLADGGFVVTWHEHSPQNFADQDIKAQIFAADGSTLGEAFIAHLDDDGAQFLPSISALADGGFVITWHSFTSELPGRVRSQIFAADGSKRGDVQVSDFEDEDGVAGSVAPDIATLENGNFVVLWTSASFENGRVATSIKAQIYTKAGERVGTFFPVTPPRPADGGTSNPPAADDRDLGSVTALPTGGFVVTWTTRPGGDFGSSFVSAQVFDAAGVKVGDEITIKDEGVRRYPVVAALGDEGRFVIAWSGINDTLGDEERSVGAQVFDASGSKLGSAFLVNTGTDGVQDVPDITSLSDSRFVVTWTSYEKALEHSLKAQIFEVADGEDDNVYIGTAGANGFTAPTDDDWQISGLGGADVLAGNAGDDVITGGAGKDLLTGGAGADVFVFALGDSKAGGGVRDVITDFTAGVDKLDLTALNIDDFASAVTFKTIGTGLIVYVDTNGNGFDYSDFGVQLTGVRSLAESDFLL